MGNSTGSGVSKQAIDAKGNVVTDVFLPNDSRHVAISTSIGTVCTQISTTGTDSQIGMVRFAEITATVACHYWPVTSKALASGSLFVNGDHPYLPANVPKLIALGDNSFIGVRAAVGALAGTLHITLLY